MMNILMTILYDYDDDDDCDDNGKNEEGGLVGEAEERTIAVSVIHKFFLSTVDG